MKWAYGRNDSGFSRLATAPVLVSQEMVHSLEEGEGTHCALVLIAVTREVVRMARRETIEVSFILLPWQYVDLAVRILYALFVKCVRSGFSICLERGEENRKEEQNTSAYIYRPQKRLE